jgi:type VI secretion system protein ImpC
MADASTNPAAALQGLTFEGNEFSSLLNKEFKPKSEEAKSAVEQAVLTLAQQALVNANVIGSDVLLSIEAMIAELDRKLSEQVNTIMHHEDFQKLESAWRGLHYLVNNTETDEMLKIRVMNISKNDVAKTLKRFKGTAWDQSPLFKKVYEEEYGQFGGEPFGCLVGDYYFDQSPQDVEFLGEMSKVCAAAHAPFIAAANPSLMQMGSWQELANPRDLTKIFSTPEYAGWRSLRESDDARYLGLAMPRFLSRLPYGAKTSPVEEFNFEEETGGGDHSKYTWTNAAYAMAVNINRSYKLYGWGSCIRGIESGGAVEGLPTHTFPTDDGGVDMKCPTEIAISDRREAELAKNGFMPLVHTQEQRLRGLHRRAVVAEATGVRRSGRHRQRQPGRAAAVPVRVLPLRALPQVHRARQDRFVQGTLRHGEVAQQLDHELRRRRPGELVAGHQGPEAARSGRSHRRGNPRQSRLLQLQVLPAAALSARRADRVAAAGVQAAVPEAGLSTATRSFPTSETSIPPVFPFSGVNHHVY